jgi:hypothetical protein
VKVRLQESPVHTIEAPALGKGGREAKEKQQQAKSRETVHNRVYLIV